MTAPPASDKKPLLGVDAYVLGVLFFAGLDTLTKLLTASHHYPVTLVAWARYFVQFLLVLSAVQVTTGKPVAVPTRPIPVLGRSLSLVACTLLMGFALRRLPLAEAEALVFTAPLLVMLLAKPLLGEALSASKLMLAALGLLGVVLIARPTGHLDALGIVFALGNALTTAIYQLLSRSLRTEQPLTLLYNSALVGTLAFAVFLPFVWRGDPLNMTTLALFLGLGLTAGIGHFLLTVAFRYAPASLISPISYLQLLWGGLLGWLVFGHLPDPLALLGMLVIAGAGIGLIAVESKKA